MPENVSLRGRRHGRPTAGFEILRDPWVLSRMHVRLDVSQSTDIYTGFCFEAAGISNREAAGIQREGGRRKGEGERGNGQ